MTVHTLAEMMASAPAPLNSNTAWGQRYAADLRRVIEAAARRAPRSVQKFLGPSELGVVCDRQVVGKMSGVPHTNHVADPWPSIVGTAVHAWLAEVFSEENLRAGVLRWATERRVTPPLLPNHPGTGDVYDAVEQCVGDWKVLGVTTMQRVKDAGGPPVKYVVQLRLYRSGFEALGLPVRRTALIALPRTRPSLSEMYVWEDTATPEEVQRTLVQVAATTHRRIGIADQVRAGLRHIMDVPAVADSEECYFCPFYRPQAAHDRGPGCPGNAH